MIKHPSNSSVLFISAALATFALAGCGGSPNPATVAPADTAAGQVEAAQADTAKAEAARLEAERAAELSAKEKELADREYAVKQQELEQELAKRDAELAAAKTAQASAAAPRKATPARTATAPAKAAPPAPIVVPAGTPLAIALSANVNTKKAVVGDAVQGHLSSDVVVNGKRAVAAGATVNGSVTKVVSGSNKIGGVPMVSLAFSQLVLANGKSIPITGTFVQEGVSETGKDTAKIVGGAAAGAIIGHQVSSKNGAIVGGVLGGAAGTAAAQKTGGEVKLTAGSVITVTTGASFQVDGG